MIEPRPLVKARYLFSPLQAGGRTIAVVSPHVASKENARPRSEPVVSRPVVLGDALRRTPV